MSNRTDAGQEIDLKIALNRRKVIEALRSGKHKQAVARIGRWWSPDASVCFLGLVMRVMHEPNLPTDSRFSGSIAAEGLGLVVALVNQYVTRNDNGASFLELADTLEAEPPPVKNTQQPAVALS